MDGFFSSAGGESNQLAPVTSTEELSSFEAAIGKRFGTASTSNLLTTRIPPATVVDLSPPTSMSISPSIPFTTHPATPAVDRHVTLGKRSKLLAAMSTPTAPHAPSGPLSQLTLSPPSRLSNQPGTHQGGAAAKNDHISAFTAHTPADIPSILRSASSSSAFSLSESASASNPGSSSARGSSVLLIDIRNHHHFVTSRIHSSINLSVPSTLLKRPAFGLAKLAEMIPLASDRSVFSRWQRAEHIIVYDADSNILPIGNNVLGLLRKFRIEGFQGQLGYIIGGFNAVARLQPDCVGDSPLTGPKPNENARTAGALMSHQLPSSAFQQSSTVSAPGTKPTEVAVANPFYDNIRQNLELSTGITERIPLIMPRHIASRARELPFQWLRDIVRKASACSAHGIIGGEALEDLAMQFYRVELGEQRRLNGVMEHHSKESMTRPGQQVVKPVAFPYSITAGVEKGTKNRHRNIWPFEHARVRLQHPVDNDGTGYINASYVQPRCTALKYIATQGPLAATFTDFWTLVWEQNVGIIVMLTKQMEGHSVKCHCYWKGERFGPLRLEMVGVEGPTHLENDVTADGTAGASGATGFDFGGGADVPASPMKSVSDHGGGTENKSQEESDDCQIIRRTFILSHTGHPSLPSRKVVQLQFLGWPDLNVPSSSRALLRLIRELDTLRTEYRSMGSSNPIHPTRREKGASQPGPVLVHCSAGVGRTGSFVVIDAVLDAIRREARVLASVSDGPTKHERDSMPVIGSKHSLSSEGLPSRSVSESRETRQLPADSTDQCGVAVVPPRNPTVTFDPMPESQLADSGDKVQDSDPSRHQASVINLDSRGNEVVEPDTRTVKKRKSSGGGGTGHGNALRESGEASTSAAPVVPLPAMHHLHLSSSRQTTGKPFELDPRKLQAKRSSATRTGGGSHSASDSVDSLPSSFASQAGGSTSAGIGGSSTAPTSLSSSPHLSSALVNPPMRMPASEVERQLKVRPADSEKGLAPLSPSSASSFALERAVKDRIATPPSSIPEVHALTPIPSGARSASRPTIPFIDAQRQSAAPLRSVHLRAAAGEIGSAQVRSNSAPSSSPNLAQLFPTYLEPRSSPPKAGHSFTHLEGVSIPTVREDTSVTPSPSTSTPSEMALDDDVQSQKTTMVSSTSHPLDSAKLVVDYAPPRQIYLSKDIKRNVKAAANAPVVSAEQSLPHPPPYAPVHREGSVRSSSPSRRLRTLPGQSPSSSPAIPNRRQRDAGPEAGEDKEADLYVISSDEFSPSSPDLLTEIEEPIRQVLEDMREQRMSLCQSLRQYVFVHLAILEGALAIVDEEKALKKGHDNPARIHDGTAAPLAQRLSKDHSENYVAVASGLGGRVKPAASAREEKRDLFSSSSSAKRLSMKRKKRSNDSESPRCEKMFVD